MGGGTIGTRLLGLLLLSKNLTVRLTNRTLQISGRNVASLFDKSLGLKQQIILNRIISITRRKWIGVSIFDIHYLDGFGLVQRITLISRKAKGFYHALTQYTDLPQHLKQF